MGGEETQGTWERERKGRVSCDRGCDTEVGGGVRKVPDFWLQELNGWWCY